MKKNMIFILMLLLATPVYADGLKVGSKAPNIVGRTMVGKLYRLSKDVKKPKVINFFWVYCKPCKKEMPELAVLEKKYPNVKFISVHTEDMKKEKVEQFLKGLSGSPSHTILSNRSMKKQFKFMGLPHTVVLDADNTVRARISGYTEENMKKLEDALKRL